jgi:uncharacterized protein YecE (DUF72 family)
LADLAVKLSGSAVDTWCIFDNTGSGSAAANALELRLHIGGVESGVSSD